MVTHRDDRMVNSQGLIWHLMSPVSILSLIQSGLGAIASSRDVAEPTTLAGDPATTV